MQLSVTQTITSTENNYKGNVNFTGGKNSNCRFASEPKISNIPKKSKHNMKASSLTLRKTKELIRSYKHSLQR